MIAHALQKMGVYPDRKGYASLIVAIEIVSRNGSEIAMTGDSGIYARVAKATGATPAQTERNMRSAIQSVMKLAEGRARFAEISGYVPVRNNITTKSFIHVMARRLKGDSNELDV
jgi:hypothetical protein